MFIKVWSLLLFTLFVPQTQVLSLQETQEVLSTSVRLSIKMYRQDEDGKIQYGRAGCSGTYITPNHVLTAAHCFPYPVTNVWVKGYNEPTQNGVVLKLDPEHDLALVAIRSKKPHVYAKLAKSVRIGEKVIVVGSPLSLQFALSEGIVSVLHVKSAPFKSLYLIHTGMINPGSSGGGAFNKDGELLGVNTMSMGGFFGWAGISMAVSIEDIRRFLK